MVNPYVISIKRIKSYYNRSTLSTDEQFWEYVGMDIHSGHMSTGYPCFSTLNHAEKFETVEKAKEWFVGRVENFLIDHYTDQYDWTTLGIRKIIFKTVEMIHV